ncbi:MAG TPA: signal peptidase II [Rhodothermales bacterium]
MTSFLALTVLVPAVDQAVKRLVRRRLAEPGLSLGMFGRLQAVDARVWAVRATGGSPVKMLWAVWAGSTAACAAAAFMEPRLGWSLGLMVGGALSHALETTLRGTICDYVCLRFWPPFNLADVALTVGLVGALFGFIQVVA